jgi:hypothetical protein
VHCKQLLFRHPGSLGTAPFVEGTIDCGHAYLSVSSSGQIHESPLWGRHQHPVYLDHILRFQLVSMNRDAGAASHPGGRIDYDVDHPRPSPRPRVAPDRGSGVVGDNGRAMTRTHHGQDLHPVALQRLEFAPSGFIDVRAAANSATSSRVALSPQLAVIQLDLHYVTNKCEA